MLRRWVVTCYAPRATLRSRTRPLRSIYGLMLACTLGVCDEVNGGKTYASDGLDCHCDFEGRMRRRRDCCGWFVSSKINRPQLRSRGVRFASQPEIQCLRHHSRFLSLPSLPGSTNNYNFKLQDGIYQAEICTQSQQ